jgi:hypothetical protein
MVQIAKVQPLVGLGVVRARVELGDWLVAEVQAPAGQGYADLLEVFAVGTPWPLPRLPAGYRLLGYLDPRDFLLP